MTIKNKKDKLYILHNFQKEDEIHDLLAKILPQMGFKDVITTSERDNCPENGKDLICSFFDTIEEKKEWYAFVVKKGTISGTSIQINEIESQIKDYFKYEYKSLKTISERVRISKVKVVTNEHFSSGAKDKILSNDEINKPNVDFWDEEKLIQLTDKYYPDLWKDGNYLFHRLRHEIPDNTWAIESNIERIRRCLNNPEINRNDIHRILNIILLNNNRIYLLANYFTTVDFKLQEFAKDKVQVSLHEFLNTCKDNIKTEAYYRNVGVYFKMQNENKTLFVSNYYLLAIENVINNAIRYAAEGTLVYIEVRDDRLTVTDVGIPIKGEMKDIFKEGFRSEEARAIYEKGSGLGLYLAKMIFDAHDSKIEPKCEYLYRENYYLQKSLYEYLSRIPDDKRNRIIYHGLDSSHYPMADELYKHIRNSSNSVVDLDMQFYNPQKKMMQKWLDYLYKYNCVFLDMEDAFFNKEVYKVTFTIYFNK